MFDIVGGILNAGARINETEAQARTARNRLDAEREMQDKELQLQRDIEAGRITQAEANRELEQARLNFEREFSGRQLESQETQSAEQRALQERMQNREMELTREVEAGRITQAEADRELEQSRLETERELGTRRIESAENISAEDRALQERLRERELGQEREIFEQRFGESADVRNYGRETAESGYERAMAENDAPNAELEAMRQAVERGYDKGVQKQANQAAANLTRSGVRGGQAARLMNESTADYRENVSRDLTQKAYEDSIQRRQNRTDLAGARATAGYQMAGART